jgi:hypothetical protein
MTKKLVSEFDPVGWNKVQQTMLAHGNAYFCTLSNEFDGSRNSRAQLRKNVVVE